MTNEQKQLLIKDLCARLPYKPMVLANDGLSPDGKGSDYTLLGINTNKCIALLGLNFDDVFATSKEYLDNIKPYLRPMSSMTEEEMKIYNGFVLSTDEYGKICEFDDVDYLRDWLDANHFDHRELILKGLALVAPEGIYSIKNE